MAFVLGVGCCCFKTSRDGPERYVEFEFTSLSRRKCRYRCLMGSVSMFEQCLKRFFDGPQQGNHERRSNIEGRHEVDKFNDSEVTPKTEVDAGIEIA